MTTTRRNGPGPAARFAALTVALLVAGCGGPTSADSQQTYEIPGDTVFPEGVAVDKSSGEFYVGSTSDGTIFRGTVGGGDVEEFLPGGQDGRTAVTGLKVDAQGRLWAAGRDTGRAFVYDTATGDLIRALTTPPADRTLINDLTLTDDAAFFTDSFRPVIWRVSRSDSDVGEMEAWLDLRETEIPTDTDFGLNGISASDNGSVLLTVHFDTGQRFRIDVATGGVTEVDLGGETLTTGDGILLDGQTLLVVREDPGAVFPVQLSADLTSGVVGEPFSTDLQLPTTLAEYNGEVLVVNSQFGADNPDLPFTVSGVPLPDRVDLGS